MANCCDYEMKIKGSKEAIQRVIDCLKADYDYDEGKPSHKHFFRVFSVYDDEPLEDNGDGTFTKYIFGDCAWSVYSCMCRGGSTYYDYCKMEHPDTFMGTNLTEQSQDCEIEIFSEEPGCEFSEHYIYKNGECLADDCVDVEQGSYDDDGNITTEIDWDEYDGDQLCLNPHRYKFTENYRWEI